MPCDQPSEDEDLVRRIRDGEEGALGALMQRYGTRVYSTAFQVLRQRSEAEEVTQDVFWAVWRSPERFDSTRGPLRTWLMILSRSRALDLLRQMQAAARSDDLAAAIARNNSQLPYHLMADRKLLVEELLQRLPIGQQWVMRKIYVDGYAVREISDALTLPPGTIKSRTRLALRKLRSEATQ